MPYQMATIPIAASPFTPQPEAHGNGATIVINFATFGSIVLPPATGSGNTYTFVMGIPVTVGSTTIKVANANDTMIGTITNMNVVGGAPFTEAITGADDTITMNGSTTGGLAGSRIDLIDFAANKWLVDAMLSGSSTLITSLASTV